MIGTGDAIQEEIDYADGQNVLISGFFKKDGDDGDSI